MTAVEDFVRSSLRPHNANELPGKLRECLDSLMDAVSEADKIEILRTRNDALMVGIRGVPVSEVFPIVRHHSPTISTGISQHGFIREFLRDYSEDTGSRSPCTRITRIM